MFFSEHRLKIASLRIGKHRIVKNIASLRKVNIAHPYLFPGLYFLEKLFKFDLTKHCMAIINRLGTLNFIAVDNNMVAIFLIVVGHDHYQ